MTARGFIIFNIFTMYLSFISYRSHGFEVIQPHNQTVNPDGSAFISCEHTANVSSVEDARLNSISPTDNFIAVCQKGKTNCENIIIHQENPNKCLFIIRNITLEAMDVRYQCEFTVKKDDLDYTATGTPTILLPSQKEVDCVSPPPLPPPPSQSQLRWILIGLLALLFLYSCVITSFYIRLRCCNTDPENSTYVEMRKVPLPRNPPFDIYCG